MSLTLKEKIEKVKNLRPIDDVFFEVLAKNPNVCQEMLRVILDDDTLVVNDVITQASERNIYGRSVRLDALCTLGNGVKCNIEVQRSDNDNHLKRARFNASSITVKDSKPGDTFEDIIELYIVYISEFDFFKGKKTIYHVESVLKETEGGLQAVCEEMKKYEAIAVRAERIEKIHKMIQLSYSKESILELDYTEEEYLDAKQKLYLNS